MKTVLLSTLTLLLTFGAARDAGAQCIPWVGAAWEHGRTVYVDI